MLDHIGLCVSDFEGALEFYEAALKPLGYVVIMKYPGAAGLGVDGKPDFWVMQSKQTAPTHIAFATDRASATEFYKAALKAGGKDNGKPGLRPEYHPNYFGAFVKDPEGNNIEAVCHAPVAKNGPAKTTAPAKAAPKPLPAPKAKAAVSKKPAAKKPVAKAPVAKKTISSKKTAKKAPAPKKKR